MEGWLGGAYPWVKAFHLIAVLFWMAALFMLPRFLAYHAAYPVGGEEDQIWQEREARLTKIIMNPSMMVAWVLGLALVLHWGFGAGGWLHAKLLFAVLMTVFHVMAGVWRKSFIAGENTKSSKFYRVANEVPTLMTIVIVILVIVKPF